MNQKLAIRIGGRDSNTPENILNFSAQAGTFFSGLLGYLHIFKEAKSCHDICKAEKLCRIKSRDCGIHAWDMNKNAIKVVIYIMNNVIIIKNAFL